MYNVLLMYLFAYYTINIPCKYLYEHGCDYLFICLLKYYTATVLFK